jgi:hypothetical protein
MNRLVNTLSLIILEANFIECDEESFSKNTFNTSTQNSSLKELLILQPRNLEH